MNKQKQTTVYPRSKFKDLPLIFFSDSAPEIYIDLFSDKVYQLPHYKSSAD